LPDKKRFSGRILLLLSLATGAAFLGVASSWGGPGTGLTTLFQRSASVSTPTQDVSSTRRHFLHLSDIHLQLHPSYHSKDASPALWKSAYDQIKNLLTSSDPPEFILYTGDLPGHIHGPGTRLDPTDREKHNANTRQVLADLRKLANLNRTPLLYLPGNNDSIAGDYYSFADEEGNTPLSLDPGPTSPKDPFPALHANQACAVGAALAGGCMLDDTYVDLGFYSAKPIEGLRVLALNSIIWFHSYFIAIPEGTPRDQAPQIKEEQREAQMSWFKGQLEDAKTAGDKVFIAMHIPPGVDGFGGSINWVAPWLDRWLDLVQQHPTTITGVLFGHSHLDETRRIWDPTTGWTSGSSGNRGRWDEEKAQLMEVAISAPGIAHDHGNNPGFKQVYFDDQMELLDFTTHYTWSTDGSGSWRTYEFTDAFPSCNGKTMKNCLAKMKSEELCTGLGSLYTVKKSSYPPPHGVEVLGSPPDHQMLPANGCS
jgi:hypothetical protein